VEFVWDRNRCHRNRAQARIELEKACEEIKQRDGSCPPGARESFATWSIRFPAHVWSTSPEGEVDFVNDRLVCSSRVLTLGRGIRVEVGKRFFIPMTGRGSSPIGTQQLRNGQATGE